MAKKKFQPKNEGPKEEATYCYRNLHQPCRIDDCEAWHIPPKLDENGDEMLDEQENVILDDEQGECVFVAAARAAMERDEVEAEFFRFQMEQAEVVMDEMAAGKIVDANLDPGEEDGGKD